LQEQDGPSSEASSGTNLTACTATRTRVCSLRPSVPVAKPRNGLLKRNNLRILAAPVARLAFSPGELSAFSHVIGSAASLGATKRSQYSPLSPADSAVLAISPPRADLAKPQVPLLSDRKGRKTVDS